LLGAFATPNVTRNREVARPEAIPNSLSARSGMSDRSCPTRDPTSAVIPTNRTNWGRFARIPLSKILGILGNILFKRILDKIGIREQDAGVSRGSPERRGK
jgi:hypothetical protein